MYNKIYYKNLSHKLNERHLPFFFGQRAPLTLIKIKMDRRWARHLNVFE